MTINRPSNIRSGKSIGSSVGRVVSSAIRYIRRVSGDDAYDLYLQHHHLNHPDQLPMSRRSFYLAEQQRKWSGVKRCC